MRATLFYALSALIMSFYGGEICPHREAMSLVMVSVQLTVAFTLMRLIRHGAWSWVLAAPEPDQPRRVFALDLLCILSAGALVGLYDVFTMNSPAGSAVKMILGCGTLGALLGMELALAHEHDVFERARARGLPGPPPRAFLSLTRAFATFIMSAGALIMTDVLLVIHKDLAWIVMVGQDGLAQAQRQVAAELGFVIAVLTILSMRVAYSYARNIKMMLDDELRVLDAVAHGDLDGQVVLQGAHELGRIAARTNDMVKELREQARLRDLFGKVVSPQVARRLLAEDGERLGGARHEVVVLFSDVRGFTSRSEHQAPEALLEDLNRYFSRMVELVHTHHGVVDKFIGDGMMAVFGLDEPPHAAEHAATHATTAAIAMLEAVDVMNTQLHEPMHIGIGLHRGEVIAGNIGSRERLEFTCIGDAVNVAARIESQCKTLNTPLLISDAVREALPEDLQARFHDLGEQALKGKSNTMRVHGLL